VIVAAVLLVSACGSSSKPGASTSTSTSTATSSTPTSAAGASVPSSTAAGAATPTAPPTGSVAAATAPTVTLMADPPLGAPFRASSKATFPQVAGAGLNLAAVNAALRAKFLADEATFAHGDPGNTCPVTSPVCKGAFYQAAPDVTAASTGVISVLTSVDDFYPGAAHPYQHWIATTLQVPSGHEVGLTDLFRSPPAALLVVARAVRAKLQKSNSCITQSWYGVSPTAFASGINPVPANYRDFALTPVGLDVGIDQGQTAAEACGSYEVLVPWTGLRSALTSLGADLVGSAIAPTRSAVPIAPA
jgi:hypothetical protein